MRSIVVRAEMSYWFCRTSISAGCLRKNSTKSCRNLRNKLLEAGKTCKTSVAKLCLHNFITEWSRGRRRRQKGLLTHNIPCLRKVVSYPYGLNARFTRIKLIICPFALCAWAKLCRTLFEGPQPNLFTCKMEKTPWRCLFHFRAGKGFRTLDIDLGKVALYQLSYSREFALI